MLCRERDFLHGRERELRFFLGGIFFRRRLGSWRERPLNEKQKKGDLCAQPFLLKRKIIISGAI